MSESNELYMDAGIVLACLGAGPRALMSLAPEGKAWIDGLTIAEIEYAGWLRPDLYEGDEAPTRNHYAETYLEWSRRLADADATAIA